MVDLILWANSVKKLIYGKIIKYMMKITDICSYSESFSTWDEKITDLCRNRVILQICVFHCWKIVKKSPVFTDICCPVTATI